MKAVTERCLSDGVNPAEYNKGAWFVGSHFNDISEFFGVTESERRDRQNCIARFDPDKLRQAITEYARQAHLRTIFAP